MLGNGERLGQGGKFKREPFGDRNKEFLINAYALGHTPVQMQSLNTTPGRKLREAFLQYRSLGSWGVCKAIMMA